MQEALIVEVQERARCSKVVLYRLGRVQSEHATGFDLIFESQSHLFETLNFSSNQIFALLYLNF